MEKYDFIRTGTQPDREPAGTPFARGMFLVIQANSKHGELTDDELMKINLHAQKELCDLSPVYQKAQKHWSDLPHTPARQMNNMMGVTEKLTDGHGQAQEWIDSFASQPGLVYIFCIDREIDLRSGKSRKPFPVVGFSFGRGFDFLDDIDDQYCIKYRIYYAYAEE